MGRRWVRRAWGRQLLAAVGAAVGLAVGAPTAAQQSRSAWLSPLNGTCATPLGRLSASLVAASIHGRGIGLAVGATTWQFLEAEVAYAYRLEHSVATYLKLNLRPHAVLNPYVPVGYDIAITVLPHDVRLLTHKLYAGAGLQVRFAERYFLGMEAVLAVPVARALYEGGRHYEVKIREHVLLEAGFSLGLYLL